MHNLIFPRLVAVMLVPGLLGDPAYAAFCPQPVPKPSVFTHFSSEALSGRGLESQGTYAPKMRIKQTQKETILFRGSNGPLFNTHWAPMAVISIVAMHASAPILITAGVGFLLSLVVWIRKWSTALDEAGPDRGRRMILTGSLATAAVGLFGALEPLAAQGTPSVPALPLQNRALEHLSQIRNPVALTALNEAAYWQRSLNLPVTDAAAVASWIQSQTATVSSGLENLGIAPAKELALALTALIRRLRLGQSLIRMQAAQTDAERTTEFVDVMLRQGLFEEQETIATALGRQIRITPQGNKLTLDYGKDIQWDKWLAQSPSLIVADQVAAAARLVPGFSDVTIPFLQAMSDHLNPTIENDEKLAKSQPVLDRVTDLMADWGFSNTWDYENVSEIVLFLTGDFLKLDTSKQELWDLDGLTVPIVPGAILGRPSEKGARIFALTEKKIVVRNDVHAENTAMLIRDLRRAARPSTTDPVTGKDVNLRVFKEIAEETFKGVADNRLVDTLQRGSYSHELLHIHRAVQRYTFHPTNSAGQPLTLQQALNLPDDEWQLLTPSRQKQIDEEMDAYLGSLAFTNSLYWDLAEHAQDMAEDRLDSATVMVSDWVLKGLALRLAANTKLRGNEPQTLTALAAVKRQLTLQESVALLELLRTRGVTPQEISAVARQWYEKDFGPLPKTIRPKPALPAAAALLVKDDAKPEETRQVSFRIDEAALRKFRHLLIDRGDDMTPFLQRALRHWLLKPSEESPSAVPARNATKRIQTTVRMPESLINTLQQELVERRLSMSQLIVDLIHRTTLHYQFQSNFIQTAA